MKVLRPVHPLARSLTLLAVFFLLFVAARALLYLLFRGVFEHLTGGQIGYAFLSGLRFDVSIILTLVGGPLVFTLLPFQWARSGLWQKIWIWFCFAALVLCVFLFTGDFILFHQQGKHLGAEITIADHDLDESLLLAVTRYTVPVVLMLLGLVGMFLFWRRQSRRFTVPIRRRLPAVAVAILAAAIVILGARGSLSEHRLMMADAHHGLPAGGGKLVMNGPFLALHSLAALGRADVRFYPWDEAVATVRGMLISPEEEVPNPEYPMFRRRRSVRSEKPNVVVVMLEGWPASAVDSIRASMGQSPLGLTPEFDRIAARGRIFTRFYACGRRTRNGLSAMLAGMPSLPHLPFLGRGLDEMRLPFLAQLARKEGYETFFFSGAARDSQEQGRFAKEGGFLHFTYMEDLPEGRLKAWDHDLWSEAGRKLSEAHEPFFAFIYTTNTHAPFQYPPEWEKYPPDTREHAFWNALAYADDAMGRYFRRAEQEDYFDRTIFFIAADHTQRGMRKESDPRQDFQVPCLLIGPGVTPGTESDRVGSQVDTIPTVSRLAGWEAPHGALGRSILDHSPGHGAVCTSDDLVLRVEDDGWVLHNLDERIDAKATREHADLDAIERRLKSYVEVAFLLWVKDRLVP